MERSNKIENHIGIYDGYIPKTMCEDLINHFEKENEMKKSFTRISSENSSNLFKSDTTVSLRNSNLEEWFGNFKSFFANFDVALKNYISVNSLQKLYDNKEFSYTTFRIQKTLPKEGYHVWHIEHGPLYETWRRVLAFTVYLNDVEEGGETEFLLQSTRVKPKVGRIVIWPAGFPFVHRGNPPLKGEKYILTSWILI